MKKLISYILLLTVSNIFADTVSFKWRLNTEPDLTGYRLYIGSAPGTPIATYEIPPTQNHVSVDVPPLHYAWLTAFNANLESAPAGPIYYNPVIVELVLQGTKQIGVEAFADVKHWELFRKPDVLFDPASLNVVQVLKMTPARVEVSTSRGQFNLDVDTSRGKKFFRSYVAAHTL